MSTRIYLRDAHMMRVHESIQQINAHIRSMNLAGQKFIRLYYADGEQKPVWINPNHIIRMEEA